MGNVVMGRVWILIFTFFFLAELDAQLPANMYTDPAKKIYSTPCATSQFWENARHIPAFKQQEEKINQDILLASRTTAGDTIVLPVVVHIINSNPYSISDQLIIDSIKDLNDAFARSGMYAGSLGVNTKIQFCIAKKDPDGGNTTGITRTTSFFTNSVNPEIDDKRIKELNRWDPSKYINIWLVSGFEYENYATFSCGVWSRLRGGSYTRTSPPDQDGIVTSTFGNVLVHEMGHYLGLYDSNIGDCTNNDCTVDGDRICDTPPSREFLTSCSKPGNTCNTDTLANHSNGAFFTDVPDQVENFMHFGSTFCRNRFTQGQADRMRTYIQTQRSGLLEEKCTAPCTEMITAAFTRNVFYPTENTTINFTNTSAGATNYRWLINDVVVASSANFTQTFVARGKYKVTLKAFNADSGCFASYTDFIIVNCGVTARFYSDKSLVASQVGGYADTILFTNTSYNATSFQWLVSNNQGMTEQVLSTATNFLYIPFFPATYKIRLIASNGGCSDTTGYNTFTVLDATPDGLPFSVSAVCYNQNKVRMTFCIGNNGFAPLPAGVPVTFYNGDPLFATAKKLTPSFSLPGPVPGNCYLCYTHVLDVAYHGLDKIYVVFNDAGTVIPVVFPNSSLPELTYANNFAFAPPIKTTITLSICQGQSYQGYSISGNYVDTFTSKLTGCDSIRNLNLTVNPIFFTTVDTAICQGQNYAGYTSTGTYVDTLKSIKGCDSTRTLHLVVKPIAYTTINATICDNQNYAGHNLPGTYIDTFTGINQCDSIRTLHLTVNPVKFTTVDTAICRKERYFAGGAWQTETGVYKDTAKTYLGCDSIITTNLTVHPLPAPNLGPDRGICIGDTLVLYPGSFSTYLWHNGSRDSTFSTQQVGTYAVTVTNQFGCRDADTMRALAILPLPANFLPPDTSLCRGNVLTVRSPGFSFYKWSTGSTQPTIDVTQTGTYGLQATDRYGCIGYDSLRVFFYTNCVVILIPDAFTPNGDGKNEVFKPLIPAPARNYDFRIFNRWGQLLFKTNDQFKGWDGNFKSAAQPSGTYVYQISFKDLDGNDVMKKGTVVLIK